MHSARLEQYSALLQQNIALNAELEQSKLSVAEQLVQQKTLQYQQYAQQFQLSVKDLDAESLSLAENIRQTAQRLTGLQRLHENFLQQQIETKIRESTKDKQREIDLYRAQKQKSLEELRQSMLLMNQK